MLGLRQIGYIPTYSLPFNISQITNFDIISMVLEIKKNQRTLQGYVSFFGQFFHDNFLFFEAFEILIRTNVFLF
jgi:hypothetical protein